MNSAEWNMANFNYFYQQPFPGPSSYPVQMPATSQEGLLPPIPSTDFYLKKFNPANKKEFKTVMLRNVVPEETDSPEKLLLLSSATYRKKWKLDISSKQRNSG